MEYIFIIVIVVIIRVFYMLNLSKKAKAYKKRINISFDETTKLLGTKKELLINILEEIEKVSKKVKIKELAKIKKGNFNPFELSNHLNSLDNELNEYLLLNKNFVPSDEGQENLTKLKDNEVKLTSLKKYYNNNALEFNELIENFLNKLYFKIKKEEQLEIFKDNCAEHLEILKEKEEPIE